jgi:uncharacterized membrane protein HdeD (DUF308 family)
MKLPKNVGKTDRLIRIIVGIILIGAGIFWLTGAWTYVAVILGLLAIITGIINYCWLYQLLGFSTVKKETVYPPVPPSNPSQPM